MPCSTYEQFARAMAAGQQILCEYDGYPRELCAIILGHSKSQEKALDVSIRRSKQVRAAAAG